MGQPIRLVSRVYTLLFVGGLGVTTGPIDRWGLVGLIKCLS